MTSVERPRRQPTLITCSDPTLPYSFPHQPLYSDQVNSNQPCDTAQTLPKASTSPPIVDQHRLSNMIGNGSSYISNSGRPQRNSKPPDRYNALPSPTATPHVDSAGRTRGSARILHQGVELNSVELHSNSARNHHSVGGGGESDEDAEGEEDDADGEEEEMPQPTTRRQRRAANADLDYTGKSDAQDEDDELDRKIVQTRSGRVVRRIISDYGSNSESDGPISRKVPTRSLSRKSKEMNTFVQDDDDLMMASEDNEYGRSKPKASPDKRARLEELANNRKQENLVESTSRRSARFKPLETRTRPTFDDSDYAEEEKSVTSGDNDSNDLEIDMNDDPRRRTSGKRATITLRTTRASAGHGDRVKQKELTRTLRDRKKVNYEIPSLEGWAAADDAKAKENAAEKKKSAVRGFRSFNGMPANMTGKQYDVMFGVRRGDDSDDEAPRFQTPARAGAAGAMFGSSGMMDNSALAAGTPNNLGKVSGAAHLADIDPLGVQTNIDFSHVGGMEGHIQQLKEMVSLPLLYPEVFQRFNITPPRGVLFHGPPGTGKTLLARALAASCSSEGQKISFFMRKGADCLSKWVGEAERQLRLLFDEAKNCQPSIIFFDEIDGLAPVRSSKQEQIHASIVSTLLALMDGMDGRGQVVVIGATNRPDAVDPALRRPGRFDREFYFPLPNREARLSIINIHTRGWDPPLEEPFKHELAGLTKGYGGADLRALCTEAALHAVQRQYPQIYKTTDRLLIEPSKINVIARDFTIAQKNLIPSTARSSSSAASAMPPHLISLLGEALERAKVALKKVLPEVKKPNILEEAEYEIEVAEDGGFGKEKMMQRFETMRVFKPRLVVCGQEGMGQSYIGSALLQHLETFHVQSIDLANLVSDPTLTPEARCVQVFQEARRHKPSILYIPSLHNWAFSVTDTTKATIKGLLDEIDPSDPILLLAVVNDRFESLPADIRSWFGFVKSNRVQLFEPSAQQRFEFWKLTLEQLRTKPNEFPDGVPRRKRILEVLPIAPPRAPRALSQAEVEAQLEQDRRLMEMLKFRLGPILTELKKKHRLFCKQIGDPMYDFAAHEAFAPQEGQPPPDPSTLPFYYEVDLEKMHYSLYYNHYFTPDHFIRDIEKIVRNCETMASYYHSDVADLPIKGQAMLTGTRIMMEQACDQQFKVECGKMYERAKVRDPEIAQLGKRRRKHRQPTPEPASARQSARTAGLQPEYAYNPDLNDRALKRTRSAEGEESETGTDRGKRARSAANDTTMVTAEGADAPITAALRSSPDPLRMDFRVNEITVNGDETVFDPVVPPPFNLQNRQAITPLQESMSTIASTVNELDPNSVPQTSANHLPPDWTQAFAPNDQIPASGGLHPGSSTNLHNILNDAPGPQPLGPMQHALLQESMKRDVSSSPSKPASHVNLDMMTIDPPIMNGFSVDNLDKSQSPGLQTNTEQQVEKLRTPSPIIVNPPFELSEYLMTQLQHQLVDETEHLSIDVLEQLRSMIWQGIWQARQEWNRDGIVKELIEMSNEFIIEAKVALREEEQVDSLRP